MLKITNTEVFGLNRAMVASGNPMTLGEIQTAGHEDSPLVPPILDRAEKLGRAKTGSGHDNFLSGILVTFDVKYPQYWSMEFQRYHFAQIISSQSKMHRLTMAASSTEFHSMFNKYVDRDIVERVEQYVSVYNSYANIKPIDGKYYEPNTDHKEIPLTLVEEQKYTYFMKALSNLPLGYEMWMTVTSNYLQLKTIYSQRQNHKLDEWRIFCKWIEELPMFMNLCFPDSATK